MSEDQVPFEQQDILDNPKMMWGIILGGILLLLGFYSYLNSGSASSTATEVTASAVSNIITIGDWKNAERHEQLSSAEYFVEQHRSDLANIDGMRNTHNINMMKCIDQNAINAPTDAQVSDVAQTCVTSLNTALN